MSTLPLALQLYTVRDLTARDFPGTVRQVAQLGYPAVEFAGYGGLSADDMRTLLDETGLRAASTHVELATLDARLDDEIAYCRAIGCPHLIVPMLPPDARNPDGVRRLAPRLEAFGRRCQESGLRFGYHTHDFDFAPAGGAYLIDQLLDATPPDLVALELDVYWAAFAGVDPVAYLRQRANRVALVHLKDLAPNRDFAEVGSGTLDMPAILAAGAQAGVAWYIVENDEPRMPSLESARRSLTYLRGLP
jgi:sugar phosphate isomerase/epimerase